MSERVLQIFTDAAEVDEMHEPCGTFGLVRVNAYEVNLDGVRHLSAILCCTTCSTKNVRR